MRFQPDIQKFLVASRNENLLVDAVAKGHFSGYVSLPKKFQHNPSCDFCVAHRYRKINKGWSGVSCEASEGIDSGSKGLLHLSVSLVYNRVCWGFVWYGFGLFSFEKMSRGALSDFSRHFSGSGRVGRLVFAWFWGPGARGGSFGVTKPKRDILVAI